MKQVTFFALAISFLTPLAAHADEHDEERPSFLSNLTADADYTLELFSAWFPQHHSSATVDDSDFEIWSRITMDSVIDMNDDWTFNYSLYAGYSSQRAEMDQLTQNQFDRNLSPSYIDFNSISVSTYGDDTAVSLGKEIIELGYSEIYSPVNVFGRENLSNPMHVKHVGVWQVAGEYYIEDDTFSGTIMPVEQQSYTPPDTSRWLGDTPNYNFYDLGIPTTASTSNNYHEFAPKNFGYLLKYDAARDGYDYFVSLYHGPSPYFVLTGTSLLGTEFGIERPLVTAPAVGITSTIDEWALYGEAIFQLASGDKDQDFLKYVMGASYRESEFANMLGLDEIKPIIEYAGEAVTDKQTAGGYLDDSSGGRPNRDSLLVQLEVQHTDDLTYVFGYTKNFRDKDYSYALGGEYRLNDSLALRASAIMFGGDENTHLGRWRRNDNVEIGLIYQF